MLIDGHVHLLDPDRFRYGWSAGDRTRMDRVRGLEPIRRRMQSERVSHCVVVQALDQDDETDWLLDLAASEPVIAGVVGWVDLTQPDVAAQLAERKHAQGFVGVRHRVALEADRDWLLRPDVTRGLRAMAEAGLPFELLLRPDQLFQVPLLAAADPRLNLVLDHLGVPLVHPGGIDGWAADLRLAARFPNVTCKTSGLLAGATDWPVDDAVLRAIGTIAVDAFGPDRLLFARDWPVSTLVAPYAECLRATRVAFQGLTASEWLDVGHRTAIRTYRLATSRDVWTVPQPHW